jgi:hypothetical protein
MQLLALKMIPHREMVATVWGLHLNTPGAQICNKEVQFKNASGKNSHCTLHNQQVIDSSNRIDIVCDENTHVWKMAILQGNFREMADRLRAQKIESEEADIDQTEFQLHSARKEQTLLA